MNSNDYIVLTTYHDNPVLIRKEFISSVTPDRSDEGCTWVRLTGDQECGFLVKETYDEVLAILFDLDLDCY